MITSKEIASTLLTIKAVGFALKEPITFKSGMRSPVYVDNRKLPYYPAEWKKIIAGFSSLIAENSVKYDVIAGIETAGIPHSAALSYALAKPSVFIRKKVKDHGTKSRIEGGEVAGKKVLLIEDHVTTGGSSLAGVEALRDAGALVTTCLSITDYEFPDGKDAFRKAGVILCTLTSFSEILQVAKEKKIISAVEQKEVSQWLKDPWVWTKEH
jgi:orotate phosphoribosyltransferase